MNSNLLTTHVVATMPDGIAARLALLRALLEHLPRNTADATKVRTLIVPLEKHLALQHEFDFNSDRDGK